MPRYHITTEVSYFYEVEADNEEEAEKQGWMYEDHKYNAEVQHILVNEIEDEDDIPQYGDPSDAGMDGA